MKILPVFLLFFLFLSCDNKDDPLLIYDQSFVQKWELYEITGRIGTLSGDDLDWHETYIFTTNGTFSKTYTDDGKRETVSGTYKAIPSDEEGYVLQLKLVFDDLSGNNNHFHKEEFLDLTSDRNVLFNRQYMPGDGPGLHYRRVE